MEMKDGSVVRVGLEASGSGGKDGFILVYREYYDDNYNMMGINTDDIKAIYFCDEKIYG